MSLTPDHESIRRRAGRNWLARGGGDGFDREDWIMAETALFLEMNYDAVSYAYIECDEVLNQSSDPTCRFCDLKRGSESKILKKNGDPHIVRLSARNSHTVPTFLGNRKLYSNDECKVCNEIVFSRYENAIKTYLSPFLDIEEIHGRSGTVPYVPKDGDKPKTGTYRPEWVQKSLVKMAIGIAPANRISDFADTKQWLQDFKRELPNAVKCSHPIFSSIECLPKGPRPCSITLFCKKNDDEKLISYIFVLQMKTISIQLVVPFTEPDKRLETDIYLPIVPTFPNFLFLPPKRIPNLFGLAMV